jgi:membrane protein DedA with SNARE-associated domain
MLWVMDFTALVLSVASSPGAIVVLAALLIVDGFFPLVPGETTVVALTALGAAGVGPHPLSVLCVAIVATMIGDGIAFVIGRRVGPARWRWMRRPAAARSFAWATRQIERRPAAVLIGAKFLPFARVAVTMTAGSCGLPVRRYLPLSLIGATIYTGYHVAVATVAGHTLSANPLLAVAASLGVGAVLSALIAGSQKVIARLRLHDHRSPRASEHRPSAETPPVGSAGGTPE